MVLIKEIELAFKPENNEVEAQEDEILADSVLELTNADFTKVDEYEDVAPGAIRKHVEADMRVAYPGKPTSRKRIFKSKLKGDVTAKENLLSIKKKHVQQVETSSLSSQEGNFSIDSEESENDDDDFEETGSTNEEDNDSEINVYEESANENEQASEENESIDNLDSDFDGSILGHEKDSVGSGYEDNEDEEGSGSQDDTDMVNQSDMEMDESKGIAIFSARARDIDADIAKGKSIHNQLTIWEKLIECRIKMQPTLLNANKLFQSDSFPTFKSSLNSVEQEIVSGTYSSLADLMKNLLQLQDYLLKLAPEYHLTKSLKRKTPDDDALSEKELEEPEAKKNKIGKDLLEEIYEEFKPFRNGAIQKWNEKTRLSSGKISKNDFSAFDLPTLKQIEEILLDRDRLLKRTRTKRSDYAILGKPKKLVPDLDTTENKRNNSDFDPEIFDDDDFYHKLLRDFIEKKTSDVTDVSKRGKQWLELQKLRSKMKSKVDTRASKGRKLRFTVHNKMVNFMAPVPSFTWSEEAKNELFKSLFH